MESFDLQLWTRIRTRNRCDELLLHMQQKFALKKGRFMERNKGVGRFLSAKWRKSKQSTRNLYVRLAFIEREPFRPALMAVNELGVVEAHQIKNRRVEIMNV